LGRVGCGGDAALRRVIMACGCRRALALALLVLTAAAGAVAQAAVRFGPGAHADPVDTAGQLGC
jgi:hypothetical protein